MTADDRLNAIERVVAAVPDPEIPVLTIADLGILRGVEATDGHVRVVLTPTYSGCPATLHIEALVRAALDQAGFADVMIVTRLAPAWSSAWISAAGAAKLLAYGIAPPQPGGPVACPRCGSMETEEVSRFGSTPCKAQWRCRACLEPFDRFKCH